MVVDDPKRCHNKYCNKILTEKDKITAFGGEPFFLTTHHLCASCWKKFDGQKMRGRFKNLGFSLEQAKQIESLMDQQVPGGCPFEIGHPSNEERYTESVDEWVGWQEPKEKQVETEVNPGSLKRLKEAWETYSQDCRWEEWEKEFYDFLAYHGLWEVDSLHGRLERVLQNTLYRPNGGALTPSLKEIVLLLVNAVGNKK